MKYACYIGGPYDTPDTVGYDPSFNFADWFGVPTNMTSAESMGSFVVTTDFAYVQFIGTYALLGLTKDVNWFEASGTYVNTKGETMDGHAASIGAPALAPQRALACFRN